MRHFIDRRQNPKDKHLGNRQRFVGRAREHLRKRMEEALREGSIADVPDNTTVVIPSSGIHEPRFQRSVTDGLHHRVLPGNREFSRGDRIEKPGGGEGRGRLGAESGETEDDYRFALTREEFLDLFFEDLQLPDLVKSSLKEIQKHKPRRAGLTVTGTPTNLDLVRTMRNSLGRRIALGRPRLQELEALHHDILRLEKLWPRDAETERQIDALQQQLETVDRRRRLVPYIDPIDIRYAAFQPVPAPNMNAVMFCLMDVSASMGEREKDLAKRFFVLLHLFLQRRYERIELVFIRHTHEAKEVDEETFFTSQESGGTVVSTALAEMRRIIDDRYPAREWNIYGAQASDGENIPSDSDPCRMLLRDSVMPLCQYYAYVEILDGREMGIFENAAGGSPLWDCFTAVRTEWPNFNMKRIAKPGDIYPVFRELFEKGKA